MNEKKKKKTNTVKDDGSDTRLNTNVVAEELNLDRKQVRKILAEDSEMRKIFANMVPEILADEQQQQHFDISGLFG